MREKSGLKLVQSEVAALVRIKDLWPFICKLLFHEGKFRQNVTKRLTKRRKFDRYGIYYI